MTSLGCRHLVRVGYFEATRNHLLIYSLANSMNSGFSLNSKPLGQGKLFGDFFEF